MAKIRFDVSDAPASGGVQPKPGSYKVKIIKATDRSESGGKNDIEVILEITKGKFQGSRLWTYVNLGEASAWKLREFVEALGMKPKGVLDTDKLVGKELGIVVSPDEYDGQYKARVKTFLNAKAMDDDVPDDDEDEDDDDLDEDEEDEDEDDDEDDDDDDDEEDDEDEDEDEDDEEDEEDEPEPPKKGKKAAVPAPKSKAARKKAAAAVEDEDDDEDEEDEDEDDEADDEDYTEFSLEELKEELESRGLSVKGKKDALIKRLEQDDKKSSKPF